MEAPDWFQEIDHTADIGIDVTAESLPQLFARAAEGTFRILTDLEAVVPRETQEVRVEAEDREALLVRWLSELNFLHVTQGWLFGGFEVHAVTDTHLAATVHGERYDPKRHVIYTEIKAVTFHGLRIEQHGASWHARIIYDM